MLKVISSKAMPSPGPLYAVFPDSEGKDKGLFFGLQSEYLKNSGNTPFDTLKNTIQKFPGETAAYC